MSDIAGIRKFLGKDKQSNPFNPVLWEYFGSHAAQPSDLICTLLESDAIPSFYPRKEGRGSNVLFLEPQRDRERESARERERERERETRHGRIDGRADRVVRATVVLSLTVDFVFPVARRKSELFVVEACDFFALM